MTSSEYTDSDLAFNMILHNSIQEDFPGFLHSHILQIYILRHRKPPVGDSEYRKAVYEYLIRGKTDGSEKAPMVGTPELVDWLTTEDDQVVAWGKLPRLAGIIYQRTGDLRKKYDINLEQDYNRYLEYLAIALLPRFGWPEAFISQTILDIIWRTASGVPQIADWKITRGLLFIKRFSPSLWNINLADRKQLSSFMFTVLSRIANNELPTYILSSAQYRYLTEFIDRPPIPKEKITGLVYESSVGRGLLAEKDLARKEFIQVINMTFSQNLAKLTIPERIRIAHDKLFPQEKYERHTSPPIPQKECVTVIGPLSHGSGLGAAARACVEACVSGGLQVQVFNRAKANWGRNDEAEDSVHLPEAPGDINIIHFNPDVLVEHMARIGPNVFHGRYNIGYFVWETSKPCISHRIGIEFVNEIWVPTAYCADIFRQCTDKPITIVKTPIPKISNVSWATRDYFGLPKGKYIYIFTFDGASRLTRKNPMALVRAFQQAYPYDQDVVLLLKTQNTAVLSKLDNKLYADIRLVAKNDHRIRIIDESFSANEVHALISVCDCYATLHRSEGFGYGMAEAMKLRLPVIATGYSGNADFVTDATAYPVSYTLVPVDKDSFVYDETGQEWAEPDVMHAAEMMRFVRNDPNQADKIESALRLMEQDYSEQAVGRIYRQRLDEIRRRA